MKLCTIGFAQKSAEEFFSTLMSHGIERVVDIRLNNVSQMAGFTKRDDLPYFLTNLGGIEYVHLPEFAPTKEMLEDYRQSKDWDGFAREFEMMLEERRPLETVGAEVFSSKLCCLLCSEPEPQGCHRRLVAEYLSRKFSSPVDIVHL